MHSELFHNIPLSDDEDNDVNEVVVPTTPCPLDSDQYDDLASFPGPAQLFVA